MANEYTTSLVVAHLWRAKGFLPLPCQPGTKKLVAGFGPHLAQIENTQALEFWFRARRANLAVMARGTAVILDFDQIGVYRDWEGRHPGAAASYTESTPRGGRHIFLYSDGDTIPSGLQPSPGLEIKSLVLVYPSDVQGRTYDIVQDAPILTVNLYEALGGFYTIQEATRQAAGRSALVDLPRGVQGQNRGVIAKAKQEWPIIPYLVRFEPTLKFTGAGRWKSARCPWHDDSTPSLWIDTAKDIWGCQGCKAHGDIINWHARRLGITDMAEAARQLLAEGEA